MSTSSIEDSVRIETDFQSTLTLSLQRLEEYVKVRKYEGIDPYDALRSPFLGSLSGRLPKMAATQIFVYSPLDMRGLFRVTPGRNPKGFALFMSSYCSMRQSDIISDDAFNAAIDYLSKSLLNFRSKGYHGNCWGYNFDWQDPNRYAKAGVPSMVVTSAVGNAFLDLFEITQERKYLETALSACDFIMNDLNIYENKQGICFSYMPIANDVIHNANIIGAALLSRSYSHTGNSTFLDYSRKAVDFTIGYQEPDGSWAYSVNPESGKKRVQTDFHQGFIINALVDFMHYSGLSDERYRNALQRGVDFYKRNQFDSLGRSMFRFPKRWPIDIHHQAQGIATFSKLANYDSDSLKIASRIALWAINNMQDESGYFYFQRWGPYTNRISYIRWGQAWMMFSLSQLLKSLKSDNSGDISDSIDSSNL